MAKFLHILAASVGGGMVLGAGIRLGEAICGSGARTPKREDGRGSTDMDLTARLDRIEREALPARRAMSEPKAALNSTLAGVLERMERQRLEMEAIERRISRAAHAGASTNGREDWRGQLHRELSAELDRRLEAVEENLQRSLEASNREAVEAMVASIEKRLAPRIAKLESEVSGQSASVAELRDCAIQSERSILRLLTALEKSVAAKSLEEGSEGPKLAVVR